METFCSNTVTMLFGSGFYATEVDGTTWMDRGPLLDIQNV